MLLMAVRPTGDVAGTQLDAGKVVSLHHDHTNSLSATVQESNCQTSEYALSFHPPFVPL